MCLSAKDQHLLDDLFFKDGSEPRYITHKASEGEAKAIQLFESGKRGEAISEIDVLINQFPETASLYNNRAQMFRIMGRDEEARKDLYRGLEQNPDEYIKMKINEQLGWLEFKENNLEKAQTHFKLAAEIGSREARRMQIRCNPYAELCNAMFREALSQSCYSFKSE